MCQINICGTFKTLHIFGSRLRRSKLVVGKEDVKIFNCSENLCCHNNVLNIFVAAIIHFIHGLQRTKVRHFSFYSVHWINKEIFVVWPIFFGWATIFYEFVARTRSWGLHRRFRVYIKRCAWLFVQDYFWIFALFYSIYTLVIHIHV